MFFVHLRKWFERLSCKTASRFCTEEWKAFTIYSSQGTQSTSRPILCPKEIHTCREIVVYPQAGGMDAPPWQTQARLSTAAVCCLWGSCKIRRCQDKHMPYFSETLFWLLLNLKKYYYLSTLRAYLLLQEWKWDSNIYYSPSLLQNVFFVCLFSKVCFMIGGQSNSSYHNVVFLYTTGYTFWKTVLVFS